MSVKPNHDIFCECQHRMYVHSSMGTHKCAMCACKRFRITPQYIRVATKWELFRIAWMLLFDDYKKDFSIVGKYSTFYKQPTRWELVKLVLTRDYDKVTLWRKGLHEFRVNSLRLFSIQLNHEFVLDYLFFETSEA